jgi:multidrug efflux pump subunit AcrB
MGPTDTKGAEGNNLGLILIYVNEETKNNMPHTEFLALLKDVKEPEASALSFEEQVNGPPVGNAIEASFRSNSERDLRSILELVKQDLISVPGIKDLTTDEVIGDDEVYVELKYDVLAKLGLTQQDIGPVIRTAVAGRIVSEVTLDNKDVNIITQLAPIYRQDLSDLNRLEIMDRQGNLIPLAPLASFKRQKGSPQVKRYDFKRSITLLGNVDDISITSEKANRLLSDSFQKHQKQFSSVSLKFGGQAQNTAESMQSLFSALILSLIGIFALLVYLFRSYLNPFLIMSTIPLGLFGFSIAFFLHQRPISFMALIGIIALGGIIVNSGIVLISFIDEMRQEGKLSLEEILVKSSGLRLRAVLVTSLTTVSGLLPTAYGIGGSDAILIPMTMSMAWGLTSGTLLTLIWIPAGYAILEDVTTFFAKFFSLEIADADEEEETTTLNESVL